MELIWRIRVLIFIGIVVLFLGDLLPSTSSVWGAKSNTNQVSAPSGPGKFQQESAEIEITEETAFNGLQSFNAIKRRSSSANYQSSIKEFCLPRMICELAAKSPQLLSEKETELLTLINKAASLPWSMNARPTKWSYAAHMGTLQRYSSDDQSVPMACAFLWPKCPLSPQKLNNLKDNLKF